MKWVLVHSQCYIIAGWYQEVFTHIHVYKSNRENKIDNKALISD